MAHREKMIRDLQQTFSDIDDSPEFAEWLLKMTLMPSGCLTKRCNETGKNYDRL